MTFEDKLKSIYTYDADTGIITKGGKPTGWVCANGYVYVTTPFGKKVLAHRLAWLLHTGHWPTDDIDHINRDRKDNRICNLRVLTRSQNLLNKGNPLSGINWDKSRNKWIVSAGRGNSLGRFDCLGKAYHAKKAEVLSLMPDSV